jgi:ribosomal-protein-alanine N-acetyltransferase
MLRCHFQPFPVITTERLRLRKIELSDAEQIFFLRSDAAVMRFLDKEPALNMEEAKDYISHMSDLVSKNEIIQWGISLKQDPKILIGSICYWRLQPENDRAEIGYVLHPHYWQQGIMGETLQAVLVYGFATMKLHSIEARLNPGNIASAKLVEKFGFKQEALFSQDYFFRGKYLDTAVYSLVNAH